MPRWLALCVPDGWFDALRQESVGKLVEASKQEKAKGDQLRSDFGSRVKYAWILRSPSVSENIVGMSIAAVAKDQRAYLAVALERYFAKHEKYPHALQELVPLFLDEIPKDELSGREPKYRQTTDGRYKIWHLGFDEKDDQGRVDLKKGNEIRKLHRFDYWGDWTWQYPPLRP